MVLYEFDKYTVIYNLGSIMIATIINTIAIAFGSIIGILIHKNIKKEYEKSIFTAAGIISAVIGIQMVSSTKYILILALSLMLGGLLGTWLRIEDRIYVFGELLKKRFDRDDSSKFAQGFLTTSVLFCVGAMALVGSFKAGTEGDYTILLTKSVLDGFVAIMFAAAFGISVFFSAFSVLIYQGILTILSTIIKPYVSEIMISELSATGGTVVLMIAINLLDLKKIKTGDYFPALLFTAIFVLLLPFVEKITSLWL